MGIATPLKRELFWSFTKLFLALGLVALSACSKNKSSEVLATNDSALPTAPEKTQESFSESLKDDFKALGKIGEFYPGPDLPFGLPARAQGSDLQNWIDDRVNFVYRHLDEQLLSNLLAFEDASLHDYLSLLKLSANKQPKSRELQIQMQNHGGPLTYWATRKSPFFSPEPDLKIRITGPRIGVIEARSVLFEPRMQPNRENNLAFINRLSRVSVLAHEARHSDGRGESLSFNHITCPKGHDYEGFEGACDKYKNGAYAIDGRLRASLAQACPDSLCTSRERSILLIMATDSLNRVTGKEWGDDTPQAFVPSPFPEAFREYDTR